MTRKTITIQIDDAFFEILRERGFVRQPGDDVLSYVRASADGRSRAHIDVEVRSYAPGFGVTLQDLREGGVARRQLLEDFRGLPGYRFDDSQPDSVTDALAVALSDLIDCGLPWLDGERISTPAIEAVKRLAEERRYADAVRSARERFKSGDYDEALRLFTEAGAVRTLEPTDERFRGIAEKRVKASGA